MRAVIIFLMIAFASGAHAQDYAREARWENEIVPSLVVGDAVKIKATNGREFLGLYTEAKSSNTALVLVHGLGVHPDFGLMGGIRTRLADAGYTTLSIQMPVLDKEKKGEDYVPLFPDSSDRIARAGAWLRERGAKNIVLVSHSMGSWMSNVYLDQSVNTPYKAWVTIGMTGGFQTRALGINWPWLNLATPVPILDIYGEKDFESTLGAAPRRLRGISGVEGSKQVVIAGAEHYFDKKETELANAIAEWVKSLK